MRRRLRAVAGADLPDGGEGPLACFPEFGIDGRVGSAAWLHAKGVVAIGDFNNLIHLAVEKSVDAVNLQ